MSRGLLPVPDLETSDVAAFDLGAQHCVEDLEYALDETG